MTMTIIHSSLLFISLTLLIFAASADALANLFRMDLSTGIEMNGRLPPLQHKPYFGSLYEPTDSKVTELMLKNQEYSSNTETLELEDACWALDATHGNIEKALFYVRIAQHSQKTESQKVMISKEQSKIDAIPLERQFYRHVQTQRRQPNESAVSMKTNGWMRRLHASPVRRLFAKRASYAIKEKTVKKRFVEFACFLGLCRFMFGPQFLPLLMV